MRFDPPHDPPRKGKTNGISENTLKQKGPGLTRTDAEDVFSVSSVSEQKQQTTTTTTTTMNAPQRRRGGGRKSGAKKSGGKKSGGKGGSSSPPKGYICNACLHPGHYISDCKKRLKKRRETKTSTTGQKKDPKFSTKLSRGIEKFVSKKDSRFRPALALAHKVAANVPQTYDYDEFRLSLWAPELTSTEGTSTTGEEKRSSKRCADMEEMPGLAKLLVDEIHSSVFYKPGKSKSGKSVLSRSQRWDVSNYQATDIDSCHLILDKKSPYRKGMMSMSATYGLCNEVRVWKSLIEHEIGCPECGCKDLLLGGGSAAAWGDIACSQCPTLLEIKSYADGGVKRAKKGYMYGGSYRWFKAQEQKDVQHYAVVAPSGETDGHVMLYKISHVQPDINTKFMAYFNDLPERARFGTLANLVLPGKKLFWNDKVSTTRFRGKCDELAGTVASLFFQQHARTVQRCVRKWLNDKSEMMEEKTEPKYPQKEEKAIDAIVKKRAQDVKAWALQELSSTGDLWEVAGIDLHWYASSHDQLTNEHDFVEERFSGSSPPELLTNEHDFDCSCRTCCFLEEEEVYLVKYEHQHRKMSRKTNWVNEQEDKW